MSLSSGPAVDVTDDVCGRSEDVISLDGSIESSESVDSIDSQGDAGVNILLDNSSHDLRDIPIVARNRNFFIEDELCRFQVGDQYFQVHFHIFAVQSEKARDLLSARLHHPEHLVILEDVTPTEFEKFLSVMYCNVTDEPQLTTKEDWTAVLKLSNLFDFASLRKFAIAKLFPITNSIDKIVLARDYGMDEWLEDAYLDVCMAGTLPSDDDSEALGFPTFRKIVRVREILDIRQSSDCVFSRIPSCRDRTVVLDAFFTNNHPDISTSNTSSEAYLTPTPASPVDNVDAILDPSQDSFPTPSTSSFATNVQEAELMLQETTMQALEEARRLQEAAELNMREHQRLAAEAESELLREVKQKLQMVEECRAMKLHLKEMESRLSTAVQTLEEARRLQETAELNMREHQRLAAEADIERVGEVKQKLQMVEECRAMKLHSKEVESQLSAAVQALEEARRLQEVAELKTLEHQRLAAEAESARLAEHEQKLRMAVEHREMMHHLEKTESRLNSDVQTMEEARRYLEAAELNVLEHQELAAESESGRVRELEQKLQMAEECREMGNRLDDTRRRLETMQHDLAETRRLADLERQRHNDERQALEARLHGALKRHAKATATEVQSEQTLERRGTSRVYHDSASVPSTRTSRPVFSWAEWLFPHHVAEEERPSTSQVNVDRPSMSSTSTSDHRSAWAEWWKSQPSA